MSERHQNQDLIDIFARCFAEEFNTRLIEGDDEPIYLPADDKTPFHQVVFAHGYYASAIHEISHWCIAGEKRRLLVDYGYWYNPDGRNETEQNQFQQVEIKPQALDWLFCAAADYPFNVSCDNLMGDFQPDRIAFQRQVHQQVACYLREGIPQRAQRLIEALRQFYCTPPLTISQFPYPKDLDELYA